MSIKQPESSQDIYYGKETAKAVKNFPVSGTQVHPVLIESYLLLKKAAAAANQDVFVLGEEKARAIMMAVDHLLSSDYQQHFVVDAYQAGAGTSQNMNANEVIANKANEMLGGKLGQYEFIHPNDHVNMSQSTNDTYPTVMQLAALKLSHQLLKTIKDMAQTCRDKSIEFDNVLKAGRTHLQDAVPIRLGQEFSAYAYTLEKLYMLVKESQKYLRVLGIGGSAVGTGVNVPPGFRDFILKELKNIFQDEELILSENMCGSTQSQLPMMVYSNSLRACALELTRIINDLRLMSSGPSNGLGEINLPEVQAGSSIMPGKINPSILEMGNQVCFKVLGNDQAMSFAMQAGQLELNVMMPLMAQVALESTHILTNALEIINTKCLNEITANTEKCHQYAMQTSQIITVLSPLIGYATCGEIVKEAKHRNINIEFILKERHLISEEQLQKLFSPRNLTGP